MRTTRAALHGLILAITDIAGVAGGAAVAFAVLGVHNQFALQAPVAVALSIGMFCVWILFLRVLKLRSMEPASVKELGACLVASLLWAPLIFVPLHYFTQGYVTAMGNLLALALYQLPVNALALYCFRMLHRSAANDKTHAGKSGVTEAPSG